jgi:hypothetical protein
MSCIDFIGKNMSTLMKSCCNLLGFSVAVNHFKELIGGIIWAVTNIRLKGRFNLSAGNHLIAAILDSILGVILLRWLLGIASAQILVSSVVEATDVSYHT